MRTLLYKKLSEIKNFLFIHYFIEIISIIAGIFIIVWAMENILGSSVNSTLYFVSMVLAIVGFSLLIFGSVRAVIHLRKDVDGEAFAMASAISNSVASFLIAIFSLGIAVVAIGHMNISGLHESKPQKNIAKIDDNISTLSNNNTLSIINSGRIILFTIIVIILAFIALVFGVVFMILEYVNRKNQIRLISEKIVHYITSKEEKQSTLRALLAESKRIVAYITDARTFFSEFTPGTIVSVNSPIELVCPPEVYANIQEEYKLWQDRNNIPSALRFVVRIPQFVQTISAIFFFETFADVTPQRAILISSGTNKKNVHLISGEPSKMGDSQWFVLSEKGEIATSIFSSYDSINKTSPLCVKATEDCDKQMLGKYFNNIHQHIKQNVNNSSQNSNNKNQNTKCGSEKCSLYVNCPVLCLDEQRDSLEIDWSIESAKLCQKEFDDRWSQLQRNQYFDFSDRSQSTRQMENFTKKLQSLHAFDKTNIESWLRTGRLTSFLNKIKKRIVEVHNRNSNSSENILHQRYQRYQRENTIYAEYNLFEEKDELGKLDWLKEMQKSEWLEVSHPNFFGRIFIVESRLKLMEPYPKVAQHSDKEHQNTSGELYGDLLVEVLKKHLSVDNNNGIIQVGVIYKDDILFNKYDSWYNDFAVYSRTVTWCQHVIKTMGSVSPFGGYSSNKYIVGKYLSDFQHAWTSLLPSLFFKDKIDNIESLYLAKLTEPCTKNCVARTPAEEAWWLITYWDTAKKFK
jgi:hypothetical protein